MTRDDFKAMVDTIPKQPGVYKFLGDQDAILYVGKAKNLRNRLSSYFVDAKDKAFRTRTLIKNARRIDFTIVETESDALLLENTLIKQFQPRYNVMLKDDKSYTYICIKKEPFPRVFLTRRVFRDGSTYFGPYTSKFRLKTILELIKQLFPLRTCKLNLAADQISKGKYKVCLEYHIKNCMGPCEGLESPREYQHKIDQVANILKGNFGAVKAHFREEMQAHAENLEFEKAQQLKEKLEAFEDYQSKSTVVNPAIKDVDVFSICSDEKEAYVNYLKIVNGAIIQAHTQEMVKNLDEAEADLLAFVIPELRTRFNSIAPELILPFEVPVTEADLKVTVPKIGDKKKLLELSEKNGRYHMLLKQKERSSKASKQTPAERILRTLQQDLQMDSLPLHIECFDNSNIQGAYPVAACVVFKQAKPSKKDYRHFNIKTVEGPNDFASMEEVVFRRYKRLLEEGAELPQLIVIDGGKGQLGSAMKSLTQLDLHNRITVIGIAKRLEEIFFPGDPLPLYINKKSESLKLIQQIRNEAHRFAITFHRDKRSGDFTKTELTNIPGIGAKTAEKLLQTFGSIKKLKEASLAEVSTVAGPAVAKKIHEYFTAQASDPHQP